MGTKVIADSSGLISLAVIGDSNHDRAVHLVESLVSTKQDVYIPSDIFSGTINVLGKKISHEFAVQFAEKVLSAQSYEVGDVTKEIRVMSLDKFIRMAASVSFTDCLVMAVADYFETKIIFGFDEVFEKSGYRLP